jgi:hypothetical protein
VLQKYKTKLRRTAGIIGAVLVSRYKLLLICLILIIPLTLGYSGDEQASVTVVNKTEYYLHVIIDGESYLYVSPDMGVTRSSDPKGEFSVDAFYSPGQGITARISRTIDVPYSPASTGCGHGSSGGCECVTNPASAGTAVWEITADTMLVPIPESE